MIQDNNSAMQTEFHKSSDEPLIWITDNGSLRPEATLVMRQLCQAVSEKSGKIVQPVSLLHSSKIDAALLNGEPARTFERSVKAVYESGNLDIRIQPLFFGPSAALTQYLPERIRILSKKRAGLSIEIADPLVPENASTPQWLLDILDDFATELKSQHPGISNWIVVDHGSPMKAVAEVRDRVAEDFGKHWSRKFPDESVFPASMERREGDEYAFCDPLLENIPEAYNLTDGDVGVLMLFFLPGRHAGPAGDVAEIIARIEAENPELKIHMSPLFSDHAKLSDILAERVTAFSKSDSAGG